MTDHDRQPPDSTQRRASITWARSALTGGLLSLAALAPAAGVAAEPDTGEEGAVGPEHAQDVETDSPNFDPGGANEPTVEVGVPSPPDQPVDIDPMESEPTDDPDSRLAPAPQAEAQLPPVTPATPREPVQPRPATPPRPPGFSIQPPPPAPQSLGAEPGSGPKPLRRLSAVIPVAASRAAQAPSLQVEGTPAEDESLGAVTSSAAVGTAPAEVAQAEVEHPSPAGGGARVHIVRPGESLWTIAQGLLGPNASAMSIAAEVARLWELNRDRISSGDPDLIAVGERLKLR